MPRKSDFDKLLFRKTLAFPEGATPAEITDALIKACEMSDKAGKRFIDCAAEAFGSEEVAIIQHQLEDALAEVAALKSQRTLGEVEQPVGIASFVQSVWRAPQFRLFLIPIIAWVRVLILIHREWNVEVVHYTSVALMLFMLLGWAAAESNRIGLALLGVEGFIALTALFEGGWFLKNEGRSLFVWFAAIAVLSSNIFVKIQSSNNGISRAMRALYGN